MLKWQANGWKDGKYIEGKWLNECTKTSGALSDTTPTMATPPSGPAPPQPTPPEQTTVIESCHDWLYRIALIVLLLALAAMVVFHMKASHEAQSWDRDRGLSQSPASNRNRSLHSPGIGDYGTGNPGTYNRPRHGPADEGGEDEYLF